MDTDGWQPIETAPKGEPSEYGTGPRILGATVHSVQIVRWSRYRNPERGAWKTSLGNWTPTHWMHLPAPPKTGA